MFEPKPLSPEAVPAALEKAERYRLLNESAEAESICRDILRIDPQNQKALVMLLLALTDRFGRDHAPGMDQAGELVPRLHGEYEQAYYTGIIWERWAKSKLNRGGPGANDIAYGSLRNAMTSYERAEAIRPPGNDDAILRWNTCVRLLDAWRLEPPSDERLDLPLE